MSVLFFALSAGALVWLFTKQTPMLPMMSQRKQIDLAKKDDEEAEEKEVEKPKFDPYIA